jgi:uncharacterized protein YdhG (YjbR/CyaY superfamily)
MQSIRNLCREELDGFVESLAYGMPSCLRNGEPEVAFANQKQHISLYIFRTDVFESHRAQLSHLSLGKGPIRYRSPTQVDLDVVGSMLRDTPRVDWEGLLKL